MAEKICLASDNYSAAHPHIMQAVTAANDGFAPSYGGDVWTEEASRLIQSAFGTNCKVLINSSGTGANVFALKLMCRRHESVICTDVAHIQYQETGAAESVVGCKLLTVPHEKGKLTPESLVKRLKKERMFGKHSTSPRVVSITQPTEFGTVYTLDELKNLSRICREEHLLIHVDGSRLYNAAVHLKVSLKELVQSMCPAILSLGGTKNGLLCAEATVIFDEALREGSDYVHKQTLQLVSKMRFLSAQYVPFFKENLWETLAFQANQKAQLISGILEKTPGVKLTYPVETNQIFFTVPKEWVSFIQERITCFLFDQNSSEIRFVTSWNTSDKDVEMVRRVFAEVR